MSTKELDWREKLRKYHQERATGKAAGPAHKRKGFSLPGSGFLLNAGDTVGLLLLQESRRWKLFT
jgi:hypothetical protein